MAAAADEEPYFHSGLIFEPGRVPFEQCHGSTLVELPSGDLIAGWYAGDYEKSKNAALYAARLKKGEREWSQPWVINDAPGLSDGNPSLWLAPDGALWLFFNVILKENWDHARLFFKKSYDEGKTWTKPVVLIKRLGWIPRSKPLFLSNGDLLLPIHDEVIFRSQFPSYFHKPA